MDESSNDASQVKGRFLFMNLEMLPCKLLYFLAGGEMGSLFPFLALFYVSSGIPVSRVGFITGIAISFSLIADPLWGILIDKLNHRKLLFTILCLGTTFTHFCQPWVAMSVSNTKTKVTCLQNSTNATEFTEVNNNTCKSTQHLVNPNELFYVMTANRVISSIFYHGLKIAYEGTVIKVILSRKTKQIYGKQRVLSPVGYALGSFLSGVAVDHYKSKSLSRYTAAFFVYMPFNLMIIPLLLLLLRQAKWDKVRKREEDEVPTTNSFIQIFKSCSNLMFLFSLCVSSLCYSAYGGYFSIFMKDKMNSTATMISVSLSAAMFAELVVYGLSPIIIKYCGGPMPCIILGIFSYFPRFMLTSYCRKLWIMPMIQLFHGIGYSLSWAAQIEHALRIFPKEISTTAFGLISSLHLVAKVVGYSSYGIIYHKYGGPNLFRGVAILACVWSLIMTIYFGMKHRISKRKDKPTVAVRQTNDIELEDVSAELGQSNDIELVDASPVLGLGKSSDIELLEDESAEVGLSNDIELLEDESAEVGLSNDVELYNVIDNN